MRPVLRLAVALGLLVGCGGGASDTTPEPAPVATAGGEPEGTEGGGGSVEAPPSTPGSAFATPLELCGAGDSYAAIAQYTCPDGTIPLGGDAMRGAQARRGSLGSHVEPPPEDMMQAHIVDLYDVPCPSGNVEVYVCMYHCPEGRTPMD